MPADGSDGIALAAAAAAGELAASLRHLRVLSCLPCRRGGDSGGGVGGGVGGGGSPSGRLLCASPCGHLFCEGCWSGGGEGKGKGNGACPVCGARVDPGAGPLPCLDGFDGPRLVAAMAEELGYRSCRSGGASAGALPGSRAVAPLPVAVVRRNGHGGRAAYCPDGDGDGDGGRRRRRRRRKQSRREKAGGGLSSARWRRRTGGGGAPDPGQGQVGEVGSVPGAAPRESPGAPCHHTLSFHSNSSMPDEHSDDDDVGDGTYGRRREAKVDVDQILSSIGDSEAGGEATGTGEGAGKGLDEDPSNAEGRCSGTCTGAGTDTITITGNGNGTVERPSFAGTETPILSMLGGPLPRASDLKYATKGPSPATSIRRNLEGTFDRSGPAGATNENLDATGLAGSGSEAAASPLRRHSQNGLFLPSESMHPDPREGHLTPSQEPLDSEHPVFSPVESGLSLEDETKSHPDAIAGNQQHLPSHVTGIEGADRLHTSSSKAAGSQVVEQALPSQYTCTPDGLEYLVRCLERATPPSLSRGRATISSFGKPNDCIATQKERRVEFDMAAKSTGKKQVAMKRTDTPITECSEVPTVLIHSQTVPSPREEFISDSVVPATCPTYYSEPQVDRDRNPLIWGQGGENCEVGLRKKREIGNNGAVCEESAEREAKALGPKSGAISFITPLPRANPNHSQSTYGGKPWLVVGSDLDEDEEKAISVLSERGIVRVFNGEPFCLGDTFIFLVRSRLVTPSSESFRGYSGKKKMFLCERTFQYLVALGTGMPIIDAAWVVACLDQQEAKIAGLVNTGPYEVWGDCRAYYLLFYEARLTGRRQPLLSKYSIALLPTFDKHMHVPEEGGMTKQQIEILIRSQGGGLVQTGGEVGWERPKQMLVLPDAIESLEDILRAVAECGIEGLGIPSKARFQALVDDSVMEVSGDVCPGIVVVRESFITDSISINAIAPLGAYCHGFIHRS